jgi:galactonate dehydratase
VWNLLGGKIRDRIWAYPHAHDPERALELVERGFTALKTGGVTDPLHKVAAIREAVGPDVDLMVDVHGPPWLTTRDAIRMGRALEEYDLLFYEDPVAPEDIEAIGRVADAVDLPIAAGERHSHMYGVRQLIEREIVDVIQPDTGRAGGLMQMKKIAAMAEAHYITFAPHSGSLGPVAEIAGLHLLATLPNFLIMEHLEDDVPQRYEVITPLPEIVDGHITVPDAPGLGVDIVEQAIAKYPPVGNVSEPNPEEEHVYFRARRGRARWANL